MRHFFRSRYLGAIIAVLLIYIGAYVIFRESNTETWDRDGQEYVIFPDDNFAFYYFYRPISYIDGALTGMRFHIGSHQDSVILESDNETESLTAVISSVTFAKYRKGGLTEESVEEVYKNFENINWELVEEQKVRIGGDIPELHVSMIKSDKPTGMSGLGTALYSVDVVVRSGSDELYRFTDDKKNESRNLFSSENIYLGYGEAEKVIFKDVTNDGIKEILFYTNYLGPSFISNKLHILQYEEGCRYCFNNVFNRISTFDFYSEKMRWFEYDNKAIAIVAEAVSSRSRGGSCRFCEKHFLYRTYVWNEESDNFHMLKPILSEKVHTDPAHIYSDEDVFDYVLSQGILKDI